MFKDFFLVKRVISTQVTNVCISSIMFYRLCTDFTHLKVSPIKKKKLTLTFFSVYKCENPAHNFSAAKIQRVQSQENARAEMESLSQVSLTLGRWQT